MYPWIRASRIAPSSLGRYGNSLPDLSSRYIRGLVLCVNRSMGGFWGATRESGDPPGPMPQLCSSDWGKTEGHQKLHNQVRRVFDRILKRAVKRASYEKEDRMCQTRGRRSFMSFSVNCGPKCAHHVLEVFDESSITMLTCRASKHWLHRVALGFARKYRACQY